MGCCKFCLVKRRRMASVSAVPRRSAVVYLIIWSYCWRTSSQSIGFAQDQLQVRIRICLPGFRAVQLLGVNRLQSWQKLESEQPTEGKRDRALAMRIDVLAINLHLGAVMDHALDHRGHLR